MNAVSHDLASKSDVGDLLATAPWPSANRFRDLLDDFAATRLFSISFRLTRQLASAVQQVFRIQYHQPVAPFHNNALSDGRQCPIVIQVDTGLGQDIFSGCDQQQDLAPNHVFPATG